MIVKEASFITVRARHLQATSEVADRCGRLGFLTNSLDMLIDITMASEFIGNSETKEWVNSRGMAMAHCV